MTIMPCNKLSMILSCLKPNTILIAGLFFGLYSYEILTGNFRSNIITVLLSAFAMITGYLIARSFPE